MTRDRIFPLIDRRTIFDRNSRDRYFYRGASLESLNNDEFEDNNIDGEPCYIYYLSGFEIQYDEKGFISAHSRRLLNGILSDGPGEVPGKKVNFERIDTRWVTGGLSDNLGTGIHFGTPNYEHGLTLILDKDRVVGDVIPIRYDMSFFNQYPEVGAYIDTISNSITLSDGEIIALVESDPSPFAEGRYVTVANMGYNTEDKLTQGTYEEEDETVALAKKIGLDSSIEGVGAYFGEGNTTHNIDAVARKELPANERRNWEYKNDPMKLRILYEDIKDKMVKNKDELAVILLEDLNHVGKEHTRINEDTFIMLYDGDKFTTDYKYAVPFV